MTASPDHLLYLHGFRSSPQSFKARRLEAWLNLHRPDVRWACPQLPPSPAAAIAQAQAVLDGWPAGRVALLGSSLGGFYATLLAARKRCPLVVINPAVDPARDLAAHVGEQSAFHDPGTRFRFEHRHLDELRALQSGPQAPPQHCLAIIAKGDELLDWREMSARYQGCTLRLVEGSDHALSDFDEHLPSLLQFLNLAPPA